MKRKAALGTGILAMVLCLAMGFTAYAQGWEQDENGWWYSTDSGYLSNGFSQIDGNGIISAETAICAPVGCRMAESGITWTVPE